MKAKTKAKKLRENMFFSRSSKESASIAVDEILLTLNKDIRDLDVVGNALLDLIDYWEKVKQEIEKL